MIITITKIIYLYIRQKNVLSTNLWNKNKSQKKPRFGNIEYNGIEICTIVRCFAFKYFSIHSQTESLSCSVIAAGSILNTITN